MKHQQYDCSVKIITMFLDLVDNTKEQVLLLNKSNNKITNLEKDKERKTNLTPIFHQTTQPRGNQT